MISSGHNKLADFLKNPSFGIWRQLFIVVAIVATTLSQSFFVFGNSPAIPTYTIYCFGSGFAALTLSIIYFNIHYLAPKFLSRKAYASYLLVLLLLVLVMIMGKSTGELAVFSNAGIIKKWNGVTILDWLSNIILYTVCVASTSVTVVLRQLEIDELTIDALENTRLKNSIDEIKSRVRPQFLCTTLAIAAESVKAAPKETSETLLLLSKLLRYQLYDSTRDKVLLVSEINFIRYYLMIFQQNSDNKFSFRISVSGNTNRLVSPDLFTLCIEEICGLNPHKIVLDVKIEDDHIKLYCKALGIITETRASEQKLKLIYGNETVIEKESDTLKLYLRIC